MKFLFSLFIIVFMSNECRNSKIAPAINSEDNIEENLETVQLQDNITFEYTAISRGSYNRTVITHSTILVQKGHNSKAISKACSKDDWSKLMNLLNAINLKNISKLKAPTQARLYDGAAFAQLTITQANAAFETNSFDHGKPPKEIEALVKKILSLSENIE